MVLRAVLCLDGDEGKGTFQKLPDFVSIEMGWENAIFENAQPLSVEKGDYSILFSAACVRDFIAKITNSTKLMAQHANYIFFNISAFSMEMGIIF